MAETAGLNATPDPVGTARGSLHNMLLDVAGMSWDTALDHVRALEHDIVRKPLPVWSPLVVARAVLESCLVFDYLTAFCRERPTGGPGCRTGHGAWGWKVQVASWEKRPPRWLRSKSPWHRWGWVDGLGCPFKTDKLRREAHHLMAQAGVRKVRLYDARHACLSWVANNGVPDTVVSAWAGHSDPSFTKRGYVRPDPQSVKAGSDKLGELLAG